MSAFRYGWDGGDARGSFWLRFDSCSREPKSWKEELYAAARGIAARTKKPIWVCSSGGIDSEVACRAFRDQKIPFSVLTLEQEDGANAYDVGFAKEWCSVHGVAQKIIKIDMASFLSSDIDAYAERYAAIHPFRYLQLRLMEFVEEMGGYAVLCSGEQLYQADLDKPVITRNDLYLPFSNGTVIPLEWCKDNQTSHEPYFHFSTPELCLSYTREPLVTFALSNPDGLFRHPSNKYILKKLAYQSVWTDLTIRYKYDGFNNNSAIKPLFDAAVRRLRERFGENFAEIRLSLPEFESQLVGKK